MYRRTRTDLCRGERFPRFLATAKPPTTCPVKPSLLHAHCSSRIPAVIAAYVRIRFRKLSSNSRPSLALRVVRGRATLHPEARLQLDRLVVHALCSSLCFDSAVRFDEYSVSKSENHVQWPTPSGNWLSTYHHMSAFHREKQDLLPTDISDSQSFAEPHR